MAVKFKKIDIRKDYSYAKEKLWDAIQSLAIGPKDVRARLIRAYLSCHTLRPEHFPDELKKDWQWIVKQLTRYEPIYNHKGEVRIGSVENTMNMIKNTTGSKIAGKILYLYDQLSGRF